MDWFAGQNIFRVAFWRRHKLIAFYHMLYQFKPFQLWLSFIQALYATNCYCYLTFALKRHTQYVTASMFQPRGPNPRAYLTATMLDGLLETESGRTDGTALEQHQERCTTPDTWHQYVKGEIFDKCIILLGGNDFRKQDAPRKEIQSQARQTAQQLAELRSILLSFILLVHVCGIMRRDSVPMLNMVLAKTTNDLLRKLIPRVNHIPCTTV